MTSAAAPGRAAVDGRDGRRPRRHGRGIVSSGGARLLIDPRVRENPAAPAAYKDPARYAAPATRPAAILATHGHDDHDADVTFLANASGAPVVASGGHLEDLKLPEGRYLSINIGGVQRVGDVEIHAVPAMHSVGPGHALGYVVRFADGRTLYHTGDTWAFGDMALIERFFRPEIILFAAGGGRAGGTPAAAAFALRESFRPRVVIPMHWGALPPPFATEREVRAAFAGDASARLLVLGVEVAL